MKKKMPVTRKAKKKRADTARVEQMPKHKGKKPMPRMKRGRY